MEVSPEAVSFWLRHFGRELSVSMDDLIEALDRDTGLRLVPAPLLERVTALFTGNELTTHDVARYMQLFGPLATSLGRVAEIAHSPYFVGRCDRPSAEAMLANKEVGTYLMRWSHLPGKLAVSFVVSKQTQQCFHSLIYAGGENGYTFDPSGGASAYQRSLVELLATRPDMLVRPMNELDAMPPPGPIR